MMGMRSSMPLFPILKDLFYNHSVISPDGDRMMSLRSVTKSSQMRPRLRCLTNESAVVSQQCIRLPFPLSHPYVIVHAWLPFKRRKKNWYLNKNLLKVYRIYIFLSSLLFVDTHSLIGWILGFPECSFAALDISYVKIINSYSSRTRRI